MFPQLKANEEPEKTLLGFESRLLGATVASVGRHGKYFWLRFVKPDHDPTVMLMHFGMTGMVKLRNVDSHLIFMENGGDKKVRKEVEKEIVNEKNAKRVKTMKNVKNVKLEEVKVEIEKVEVQKESGSPEEETFVKAETIKESPNDTVDEISSTAEWPPRFTKFELVFEKQDATPQTLDFAFTDPRRLGRVRFLTGPQYLTDEQLLAEDPLKALGPDYSKDPHRDVENVKDVFVTGDPDPHHHGRPRLAFDEFSRLVLSKKKPIKSLLLDQDKFAGIGNWVSDEILFRAKIHPAEVISNKIADPESEHLQRLYEAIIFVMEESVRVEGNVREFPEDWLMLFRWGKGRKEKQKTKNGYSVDYETIGGRTSCFVRELQKPLKREVTEKEENTRKVKRKVSSKE